MEGMSGVAASISTLIIKVRLNSSAASNARASSFNNDRALCQTNQVAASDRTMPAARAPPGVSPKRPVPLRIRNAMAGG